MQKVIYFCDRCEKKIEEDKVVKINPMYKIPNGECEGLVFKDSYDKDYCEKCSKEIYQFMTGCSKADSPKKEQSEQGNKPKLDVAKIKALRDAGWPQSKIAEEMGVSQATICNALKSIPQETS